MTSLNPSKRKFLFAVKIINLAGAFYKFVECTNEKEAINKVKEWIDREVPKNERIYWGIEGITLISSLKDLKNLEGLLLE